MSSATFESGRNAFRAGLTKSDNPYISGTTKLGNPKFSDFELGSEWERGFASCLVHVASKAEREAAAKVDVRNMPAKRHRRAWK